MNCEDIHIYSFRGRQVVVVHELTAPKEALVNSMCSYFRHGKGGGLFHIIPLEDALKYIEQIERTYQSYFEDLAQRELSGHREIYLCKARNIEDKETIFNVFETKENILSEYLDTEDEDYALFDIRVDGKKLSVPEFKKYMDEKKEEEKFSKKYLED